MLRLLHMLEQLSINIEMQYWVRGIIHDMCGLVPRARPRISYRSACTMVFGLLRTAPPYTALPRVGGVK